MASNWAEDWPIEDRIKHVIKKGGRLKPLLIGKEAAKAGIKLQRRNASQRGDTYNCQRIANRAIILKKFSNYNIYILRHYSLRIYSDVEL